MSYLLPVLVHIPAHSQVAGPLVYRSESALLPGTLVRVPLGRRELLGVVWDAPVSPVMATLDPGKLRSLAVTLDSIAPLASSWRQLIAFTAEYYQRSLGEVALAALPSQLRDLSSVQLARRLKRHAATPRHESLPAVIANGVKQSGSRPVSGIGRIQATRNDEIGTFAISHSLSTEQLAVMARFDQEAGPFLLFGATGSGKTEVYLQCVERLLSLIHI